MKEEYYLAKDGDCFRCLGDTTVLKHITVDSTRSKFITIAVGDNKLELNEIGEVVGKHHNEYSKDFFERYYCFDHYLKEINKDEEV